jgi:hypothetical protein
MSVQILHRHGRALNMQWNCYCIDINSSAVPNTYSQRRCLSIRGEGNELEFGDTFGHVAHFKDQHRSRDDSTIY